MADIDAVETLTSVAQAVTGPETPSNATVQTAPSKWPTFALVWAGPFVSLLIVLCIWAMTFQFWPGAMSLKSEDLGGKIIVGIDTLSTLLAVILGVVVFRLASGGLKSVKATALSGSLEIQTGGGDD